MTEPLDFSDDVQQALNDALTLCTQHDQMFVTPEHILFVLLKNPSFTLALRLVGGDDGELAGKLRKQIMKQESAPPDFNLKPDFSNQSKLMLNTAEDMAASAAKSIIDLTHLVMAMLHLEESWAAYLLHEQINGNELEFMAQLIDICNFDDELDNFDPPSDDDPLGDDELPYGDEPVQKQHDKWKQLVVAVSDEVGSHNPLIGREAELERTIQVLCRKDKNNPLHVGEPGVGKTALVYGLADRINRGLVPERLRQCRIYAMDMGSMLAGTQYRGDFEKRIKQVMEGARREGNAIIYIDEIHNMIGAGRGSDGSLDASNMLKPYLEQGDIRFIGSTTYDEYKRYFATQRGIVRRFQQIDIQEPSVDEAILILKGLQPKYEQFHHVSYTDEAISYAVKASAKYISDRFLPDKAIDLMDEAGAYRELHPTKHKRQTVDKNLIAQVLTRTCKIDAAALRDDDNAALKNLSARMRAKIFGQDEAVGQVVEAVEMAKAGLQDDNKPLASLLFVGPTGVGKTEVARVLAQELGISLVRFDMSEYTEKHAVAKLIGSPAGYVGYEDGGLLTDAIRKTPNCVLLLDEIEKAHSDIYNILLQVMDYAVLTDNRGQKADFRNVVVVMTSNAGAQFASRANIGFSGHTSRGEAMMAQVKRTFKPEFLNRLSATVVFHDMDRQMASRILDKKLGELSQKLSRRNVELQLELEAKALLMSEGFTPEYGAREMDRVIARRLKPLLTREILFGKLRKGGKAKVAARDGELRIL